MPKHWSINKNFLTGFKKNIGPGVITGAADDDPSGIATYSIAGAKFNLSLLWTAFFTWPLMAIIQMMCARIGMVSGQGLATNLGQKFSKKLVIIFSLFLFAANAFNIGADLMAMSDAAEILSGINSHIWIIFFALIISLIIIRFKYNQIAGFLKWLVIALFAYVISAFYAHPNWAEIFQKSFIPTMPESRDEWGMIVAILGTTISPYLFYWQASLEVEEEIAMGRENLSARIGATNKEILNRKFDVGIGTLFSNLVMFFIILTTALTLHSQGLTDLETSSQVAKALEPVAGSLTMILYTSGLIGTGILAIITLAGSSAYAISESFSKPTGLDKKFHQARAFYAVILLSTIAAVCFDFSDINPIKMLYWSAILNGLLAPFLLVGILLIASDTKIMYNQPSSYLSQAVVALTIVLMFAAAAAMFVF